MKTNEPNPFTAMRLLDAEGAAYEVRVRTTRCDFHGPVRSFDHDWLHMEASGESVRISRAQIVSITIFEG